jgi:opacity protein-like surface antigen
MDAPIRNRPTRRAVPVLAALVVAASIVVCARAGSAADEAWPRWYGAIRLGAGILMDTHPATGIEVSPLQQATGLSLGVDLGPRVSLELAGDVFEASLRVNGRSIGELGMASLIPQLRLRTALADERIEAYVLGGVGVSHAQFNDRKAPGIGLSVQADDVALVGSIGAGVDYALTDGIAVGFETRYILSRGHEVVVGGQRRDVSLDALLATAHLRMLVPARRGERSGTVEFGTAGRFYLGARVGAAALVDSGIATDIVAKPENAAIAGEFTHVFAVGAGVELSRHIGLELSAYGYEPVLAVRGVGVVGEYAIYAVVPHIRVRYPLLGDRLVPYALAGIGGSYAEFNDRKPRGEQTHVDGIDFGVAFGAGAGVEYFLTTGLALGLESYYHASWGHELNVGGRRRDVDIEALLTTAGVRIYFGRIAFLR